MVSIQDNSGTIEREEFLALPQVSTNPLATRFVLSCFRRDLTSLYPFPHFSAFATSHSPQNNIKFRVEIRCKKLD